MSAAIIEYWGEENSVVLANSSIARPISLPTNWTTINIGLLYGFTTGSNTNMASSPRLSFGLCSGGTAIMGDVSASLFIGVQNNTTLTYVSSSANNAEVYSSATWRYIKRIGTTDTVSSDPVAGSSIIWIPKYNKKTLNFLKISRVLGDDTYTFVYYFNNAYNAAAYGLFTETSLLRELSSTVPAVLATEGVITAASSLTLEVDEATYGTLDHINIVWDREEPGNANLIVYAAGVSVLGVG